MPSFETTNENNQALAESFRRKFRNLILLTWTAPPVVGLGFLLYIRMFSGKQMLAILTAPLEVSFVIGSLLLALLYFNHFIKPVVQMLSTNDSELSDSAARRMRRFPLDFWGIFLVYLLLAPSTVIFSAQMYSDFVATPVDWFRIHLVALIVSIIVGLPIFFLILDLFGRSQGSIRLERAHVTIRVKVFLIGAMVPLLIDTMIVQYYWSRTGFFTEETFFIWLALELLAIAGSLIFVRSFSQSLNPLQSLSEKGDALHEQKTGLLIPQSTDELGVLTANYSKLIENWHINNEVLKINARILRSSGTASSLADVLDSIIQVCDEVIGDDITFLILLSESGDQLIGVAQTGGKYNPGGYFTLALDESSTAVWIYNHGEPVVINDAERDARVSARMREKFGVKSTIGVPLQVGNETIGVLMTISRYQREYGNRERMLMEGMAREVAIAVKTHQLYQRRIAAELAWKDNEEFLHLLMSATEEGIYGVDTKGICIFINKAGLKLLGYESEDELLGKSIHEMIHHTYPDGTPYPKDQCAVKLATQRGESGHSDQEVHWRKDGTSFETEYWSHPIYKDGKIVGTVVTFIDITERMASQEVLRYQAYHDKLTDLPNRWLLQDRIAQNIAFASRENRHGALMFMDLDRFKRINDTLGHEFGDAVLLAVSKRLSDIVREGDTLARLGGDEFVMLVTNLHRLEEAADVAKRVLQQFTHPFHVNDRDVHLGTSIGIAGYPDDGTDYDTLLKHADFAMYSAKEKGGNNYQYYTADIHEVASSRYQMEHELHQAIKNSEIEVHYQPQYNLKTGEITGLEALCRWTSDSMGVVSPVEFIAVAEETGLITPLGICVIKRVVDDYATWIDKGITPPRIAINLSARQIYSDETLGVIKQVISEKKIPGSSLEFEITESSLMDDPKRAETTIKVIKQLGSSIAIDDFGTGYSSLAYLKRFSVDVLKIDRSFIDDLGYDTDDRAIIETIIGMASNLGLSVIAEGIEHEQQAEFLLERGCYIGQGFLYSRPLPMEECGKLL